jgi:uncharacterized protein YjbJ (UPF0337 family)
MNHNVSKGKWKQIKGEDKKHWGRLTKDDLDVIEEDQKKLAGQLQDRFGQIQDHVDREYVDHRNAPGD